MSFKYMSKLINLSLACLKIWKQLCRQLAPFIQWPRKAWWPSYRLYNLEEGGVYRGEEGEGDCFPP